MTKAIPDMFLTHLLSTKETIQKFVDGFHNNSDRKRESAKYIERCLICLSFILTNLFCLFESTIVSIKWIFDLLDEAVVMYGIIKLELINFEKQHDSSDVMMSRDMLFALLLLFFILLIAFLFTLPAQTRR